MVFDFCQSYRAKHCEARKEALRDFEPDWSKMKQRFVERNKKIFCMTKDGLFSDEIAAELGMTPKSVQKFWRRYDFPSLHNILPPEREERHDWKGGVKEDSTGHLYRRSPEHPHCSKHGKYVALHRLIMERHLGRYLDKCEVVHHIDGNPKNNDVENLELFQSNAEHLRYELKGRVPNWSKEGKQRIVDYAKKRPRDPTTKRFL